MFHYDAVFIKKNSILFLPSSSLSLFFAKGRDLRKAWHYRRLDVTAS